MKRTLRDGYNLLVIGIPLLLIGSLVLVSKSTVFAQQPEGLSLGITIDLLLTVPVVYFFLIRKSNIPRTTVVPVLLIGFLVCSAILPTDQQQYLSLFKTWGLPLVEIGVLIYIIYRVRIAVRRFRVNSEAYPDFFTTLKKTCEQFLPKALVMPVVTEIAVFYYGFVLWKRRRLKENEFSYHKDSGTVPLLAAIIFLVGIETFVFHILLMKWSHTAAWILTAISVYSGIQLFGFLKSILKRPIAIEDDHLYLRYGIMSESVIDIRQIESVEVSSGDLEFDKQTRKLSFLGSLESHNVIIRLKAENELIRLYGSTLKYWNIAISVDDKTRFRDLLEARLSQ